MYILPLLFVAIALVLLPIAMAGCSLAPWVPTRAKDFPRIDKQLRLKKGSVFYEIGCGEGRVCRYIAKHNPDATVVGIEMAYPIYLLARLRQIIRPYKNLSYIHGNAINIDLSKADAIYTYDMIDTINKKLKTKFLRELKPGCRIISYHFGMKDWPGKQDADQPGRRNAKLYLYEVPK